MDQQTTLTTFLLQTSATVRSVDLVGSWDNFRKRYPMEKDLRRGRGSWRGCHSFEDISFEGPSYVKGRKRDGGLKMGGRYWYYYVLDDDVEFHSPAEPTTTGCPFLPGQAVNVLEVPFELGPEQVHGRTQSASDISWPMSPVRTMDPSDKYLKPRPAPTPRRVRLGSAPSSLLRWMPSAVSSASSWPFKSATSSLKGSSSTSSSRKGSVDASSWTKKLGNSRKEDLTIRHHVPLVQANDVATTQELAQSTGRGVCLPGSNVSRISGGAKDLSGEMTRIDSLDVNHGQPRISSATSINNRRRPSPLSLNHTKTSGPTHKSATVAPDVDAPSQKRPNTLLASHFPSYHSERSILRLGTSRFSMYSTPTTARSINSEPCAEESSTSLNLTDNNQLCTSPTSDLSSSVALSPSFSDGNGSYSTTEVSSPSSQQHQHTVYSTLDTARIRDDWYDETQSYYPYHLPGGEEHSVVSEPTIRKLTTTPNSGFIPPSLSEFKVDRNGDEAIDTNAAGNNNNNNRKYSNVKAMRSIFDELGYLGDVIARN